MKENRGVIFSILDFSSSSQSFAIQHDVVEISNMPTMDELETRGKNVVDVEGVEVQFLVHMWINDGDIIEEVAL